MPANERSSSINRWISPLFSSKDTFDTAAGTVRLIANAKHLLINRHTAFINIYDTTSDTTKLYWIDMIGGHTILNFSDCKTRTFIISVFNQPCKLTRRRKFKVNNLSCDWYNSIQPPPPNRNQATNLAYVPPFFWSRLAFKKSLHGTYLKAT